MKARDRSLGSRGSVLGGRIQRLGLMWLMATLAGSCVPSDQCANKGTTWCAQNAVMACESSCSDWGCHLVVESYGCGTRTCLQESDTRAMCVESVDKDPRCGDAARAWYCNGDDFVTCADGYRLGTQPCPAGGNWGYVSYSGDVYATHCLEGEPGEAVCIPPGAQVAAICEGGSGLKCDGTTLVQCVYGYAATSTPCHSCIVYDCVNCSPSFWCSGQVGEWCQSDADCADGLVCVTQPPPEPQWQSTSTCAKP